MLTRRQWTWIVVARYVGAAVLVVVVGWINEKLPLPEGLRLLLLAVGMVGAVAMLMLGRRTYADYVRSRWMREPDPMTPPIGSPVIPPPPGKRR